LNSGFRLKFIITSRIVADIEDSLRYIERNTRSAYRIEKLQRENITEYPVKALREAIPTRSCTGTGLSRAPTFLWKFILSTSKW